MSDQPASGPSETPDSSAEQRSGPLIKLCVGLIRLYQRYLSPLKPPSCRFTPSCSQYALESYQRHGFWGGSRRTLARLARCHPWHPGGHDPVD